MTTITIAAIIFGLIAATIEADIIRGRWGGPDLPKPPLVFIRALVLGGTCIALHIAMEEPLIPLVLASMTSFAIAHRWQINQELDKPWDYIAKGNYYDRFFARVGGGVTAYCVELLILGLAWWW